MARKKPDKPADQEPAKPADEVPDVNATKGKGKGRAADRHKSKRMVRIPDELYDGLQALAEKNDRPWGWELRRAIVAHLRAHGIMQAGQADASDDAAEEGGGS